MLIQYDGGRDTAIRNRLIKFDWDIVTSFKVIPFPALSIINSLRFRVIDNSINWFAILD